MGNAILATCHIWHYDAPWRSLENVAKSLGRFSIPVRVTISLSHKRHCEAVYGILFFTKSNLVRYLTATRFFQRTSAFLCLVFLRLQKAERSVHSFCDPRLCGLEQMTVYI